MLLGFLCVCTGIKLWYTLLAGSHSCQIVASIKSHLTNIHRRWGGRQFASSLPLLRQIYMFTILLGLALDTLKKLWTFMIHRMESSKFWWRSDAVRRQWKITHILNVTKAQALGKVWNFGPPQNGGSDSSCCPVRLVYCILVYLIVRYIV